MGRMRFVDDWPNEIEKSQQFVSHGKDIELFSFEVSLGHSTLCFQEWFDEFQCSRFVEKNGQSSKWKTLKFQHLSCRSFFTSETNDYSAHDTTINMHRERKIS